MSLIHNKYIYYFYIDLIDTCNKKVLKIKNYLKNLNNFLSPSNFFIIVNNSIKDYEIFLEKNEDLLLYFIFLNKLYTKNNLKFFKLLLNKKSNSNKIINLNLFFWQKTNYLLFIIFIIKKKCLI